MKITINGKKIILKQNKTLLEFIKSKKLKQDTVVVEYNGKILTKNKLSKLKIKAEDKIEIISFVGGG
jgi:sulfur carrier protein